MKIGDIFTDYIQNFDDDSKFDTESLSAFFAKTKD